MDLLLLLQQTLNGLQLGVMLFLMAAGLTLIFGIMDLINLAHGSFYMLGAYVTAWLVGLVDAFLPALALALLATAAVGYLVEVTALRRLYGRDHLYQVLATFGLILFFNEGIKLLFGPQPIFLQPPDWLSGQVPLFGAPYPVIRLAIIAVGLASALLLWWLIGRTRLGMLIRAGADDREMVQALGVDIARLFGIIFALGAALAALAGAMAGPVLAVRIGMGEDILILAFVVIVIGGIGSIRGAFVGALLVGLVDTYGRALLPDLLALVLERTVADAAGASIASMAIYILMALVLAFRPRGLLPARS
ncbi:MAG TPA: branched-chain amino acid ABC transporter permease [Rhodospirillales bacterium]|nr:branched-chain amino acid ABC transporter permease [Rhodospirillales bacterium]